MKLLVHDAKTGLYLGNDGQWCERSNAREFKSLQEAGRQAYQYEHANVAVCNGEPRDLLLNPVYCAPELVIRKRTVG